MICNLLITNADKTIGPIVVPRDSFVQAFVQYGAGGTGTLVLEGTLNDTDYVTVPMTDNTGAIVLLLAAAGVCQADVSGYSQVRVRQSVNGTCLASLSLPTV